MGSRLDVWFHGRKAGVLEKIVGGGLVSTELRFQYLPDYLEKGGPALSISIPLISDVQKGDAVSAFFAGLLPDDIARQKLAKALRVGENSNFTMLEQVGRECAGAVVLYPEGQEPSSESDTEVETLSPKRLKEVLAKLAKRPLLAGEQNIRLSLAGAQDKLAVGINHDGKIQLVGGGQPTSHILKPENPDYPDLVENEYFCMTLARAVHLQSPWASMGVVNDDECHLVNELTAQGIEKMYHINGRKFYIVRRYDRIDDETGHVHRLHQEDFCQALGKDPNNKYEENGGPSILDCLDLIREYSIAPGLDQMRFRNIVIFNYLIGNADAHGKNFSFLYQHERPELAPPYDLLSTAIFPNTQREMAMKIGNTYIPEDVTLEDWLTLVPNAATSQQDFILRLVYMKTRVVDNAIELLRGLDSKGVYSPALKRIRDVIRKRAALIDAALKRY